MSKTSKINFDCEILINIYPQVKHSEFVESVELVLMTNILKDHDYKTTSPYISHGLLPWRG